MSTVTQFDDVIGVRDVIERVEALREERDAYENPEGDLEAHDARLADGEELTSLESLLSDLAGYGGDEQWEGDCYPAALIRESYFEAYAQELADDMGSIDQKAQWPYTCIDWEQAAKDLQQDYSSVEFHGVTYWYHG